jgi:hypothetical protein
MRRLLFWLVFNVPLGPLGPWVLGVALGSKPQRRQPETPCPDGLLPAGATCPLCGGRRHHTGIDGGVWCHDRACHAGEQR